MTMLPDFQVEKYFSEWEFTARYHLTASDAQSMPMADLLALADDTDRRAWAELDLGYTETFGDPALREAIAGTYEQASANNIICFTGAEEGLYLAMQVLLGPEDHAIVITPNYQSAETIPRSLCEVTGVALDPTANWALDIDAVIAGIRPNTRLISINFPNNPTGKVIDEVDFRRLVETCADRRIRLFSDEVHRGLERDPAGTLPQAADLSDTALSLNVMSKSLGLPGLRIGWIACRDPEILSRLERAKHYTTICNSAPSELLARIALKARTEILRRTNGIVRANTPLFDAFFAEFPDLFEWAPPEGSCVCFPRYLGEDGVEKFCRALVEQTGVLLLPASIFASQLTPSPTDRFRIGIGRSNPGPALDTFSQWLKLRL